MRKLALLLALGVGSVLAESMNMGKEGMPMCPMCMDKKEMRAWCEQNWEKCKEHKLEMLKIQEKYLPKERECVEKAKSFQDMRLCMMDIKEQKRREMYEPHKNFLHKQ